MGIKWNELVHGSKRRIITEAERYEREPGMMMMMMMTAASFKRRRRGGLGRPAVTGQWHPRGDPWGAALPGRALSPSPLLSPAPTGGLLPPRQTPRRGSLEAPNHQGTVAFQRGNAAPQLGADVHTWTHYDTPWLDLNPTLNNSNSKRVSADV